MFDSSVGRQPIEFELGQGKVIKGEVLNMIIIQLVIFNIKMIENIII